MKIRVATTDDAKSILKIYSPFIKNTAVTFEEEVPDIISFQKRMEVILQQFPWLVSIENNMVTGYTYAAKHRDRAAYQWSVESSVYIHPDYYQRGIAKKLYEKLFFILKEQGYYNVYAGITLPNIASENFHRKMGFAAIGIYENIGFKCGAWQNVRWMSLALREYDAAPQKPLQFNGGFNKGV